ncbi:hypothetical protein [Candidatus Nitrosocosmicus hydrocola]|uniref:hypothetical protein n=1 Tax=Candidatus Nitrosocosmicus hydrocola TaxID=1826872 RepID=UPI0011E606B9|nr:hypothetical protein [Candidatus Nitrosocosmicus hydrocola]
MKANVTTSTISTIVIMTLLMAGFQSSVFAQSSGSSSSLGSNSMNSRLGDAEERISQNLEEAQQRIGEEDIGDIQSFMDLDVSQILERFKDIIPFPGDNLLGGIPGQIGVLVYTHGMGTPGSHDPEKTEPIKEALERLGYPTEIITHMPYNWDEGLQKLDEQGVKYVIFLYTDLFGPESTVIHNVTRGIFGGIEEYKYCPGVPMGPNNCLYMGMLTTPASETSDATLIFSRPASPDDRILREIFVKIAQESNSENNGNPADEIFVMIGHGARSDLNDMAQTEELTNAAKHVQQKMGYADAFGVTAREDWPDLMEIAVPAAVDQIEDSLAANNAERVVLVPATGGMGFDAVKGELDNRGISYVETQSTIPIGTDEFVLWAQKNVLGTTAFIIKENPTENTITPNWN